MIVSVRGYRMMNSYRKFSTKSMKGECYMTTDGVHHALPRIVMDPLPKLYAYDHCPFCVRVRLAFGLKNIKYSLVYLANDDIATPTSLVGKKVVPIFEMPSKNIIMPESLDIIAKIDGKR